MGTMEFHTRNWVRGPYTLGPTSYEGVVPHKWMPGDIVNEDGSVVTYKNPKIGWTLVGIVDFMNRTLQGMNARGVPLYMFHPLDPAYPPFHVASKTRPTTNMIALVAFEHWKDTWPRGGLQKILGPVGDAGVEYQALCLRTGLPSADYPVYDIAEPDLRDHKRTDWECVLHIDPDGCEDVDDILAWRIRNDEAVEFMIGIANVAAWVPEGSVLDNEARARGQTVYDDGCVVRPMLPTSLSAGSASLRCDGRERPVLGLVFLIDANGVRSEGPVWTQDMMRVTKSYTYESVLADLDVAHSVRSMVGAVVGRDALSDDPHDWIAHAMIKYNWHAARVLRSCGGGLLRRHAGAINKLYADIPGCEHLGSAAGEYVGADSSECAHTGLGLDVYTHASSPLRRYADLVNQRWLRYRIFGSARPRDDDVATALNRRARTLKMLERDLWFLRHLKTDGISDARGVILKETMRAGIRQYVVYIPEWRRKIRGTSANGKELNRGTEVNLRAYCDLKKPCWDHRIVCSISACGE